jgi:hypothetical protein
MNFNLILLETSGSEKLEKFFNALLYDGQEPGAYQETLVASYRADYLKTQDLYKENPDIPLSGSLNWEYREHLDFQTLADRWLVIARERESYTGGAHGMTGKIHYVVDLAEPKLLTLEDLFADPGDPGLYRLVQNALREYAGLEQNAPLSSGIFFEDVPAISPDFFVTPAGIVFHWDPYEIGPYSEGSIEAALTWEQAAGFLGGEGEAMFRELNARQ